MGSSLRRTLLAIAAILSAVLFLPARNGYGLLSAPDAASGRTAVSLRSERQQLRTPAQPQPREPLFMRARRTRSIRLGDSTAMCMTGDVVALHNGTVLMCDSAVRYSDMAIDCFGNVLINKNTTYIYGDRAEYRGDENRAEVFSDLVKVVDGDATLYTYRFVFDTKLNVGIFSGGGVLTNRDNLLEAERGYYYTQTHDIVCVGGVEMRNDDYELLSDSVRYNTDTDRAEYYEGTNIWNTDGDYLYADRGEYLRPEELYSITRNAYVLTPNQELWSDSLDYFKVEEHVILHGDIQIDDTEHKTLAFGDYGEYWKDPGNALLTRRPTMISYDMEGQPDSLFLSADSLYFFTELLNRQPARDSTAAATAAAQAARADTIASATAPAGPTAPAAAPSGGELGTARSLGGQGASVADSLARRTEAPAAPGPASTDSSGPTDGIDSLGMEIGAVQLSDSLTHEPEPELTAEERKDQLREAARKEREERKKQEATERKVRLEEIANKRQARMTALLDAERRRDSLSLAKRRAKAEERLQKRREKALRKGRALPDSSELTRIDSLIAGNGALADSPASAADSTAVDSLSLAGKQPADAQPEDTLRRFARAWRNVRIYRSDFQAVCDSLVGVGSDSTLHLYINPVLWNENNQISSEVMDLYTDNGALVRGEFIGHPIMIAQLDTAYYNQVSGKLMTAFFRNNEIYRNDVSGSVQTYYYLQEEGGTRIVDMLNIESGDASFYIEDKQIVAITYRNNPVFSMSPLERLPETQEHFLQDFKWEQSRRPDRSAVFDRTIRPSQRAAKSELPRPQFPLRRRIDTYRTRLMDAGRWIDRDDVVPPAILEWIRTKQEEGR